MRSFFRLKKVYLIITAFIISSCCVIIFSFKSIDDRNFEITKNLNIYYTLFRELNMIYVDEIDPEKLITESINSMLKTLDPYNTYYPENKIEDLQLITTGEYGGIGAIINTRGNKVVIADAYKDSPADKSGLKIGDEIIKINDINISKKNYKAVSELMKGDAGSSLKMEIKRYGNKKNIIKEIQREKITLECVPYYGILKNNVGYIKLTQFSDKAYNEVSTAYKKLKEKNIQSVILDLRGNPGGLLIQAVEILNIFIDKNIEVLKTKGKVTRWNKTYITRNLPIDKEIPLAILTDKGSASSSEIVAGTIQDLDRGILVGENTFGKGLVQTTRELSYNARAKITTAKYYIPSGRCIQALDYTHKNSDGSVSNIPDSLMSDYKTKNGRNVRDGRGIKPDIEVKKEYLSNFTVSLLEKYKIFDFLTENISKYNFTESTINIDNKIIDDFKKYLKKDTFEYTTKSEKSLKILIENSKKEKYYDSLKEELDKLKKQLSHNISEDVELNKEEIKEIIAISIARRIGYKKLAIIESLKYDKCLDTAISYLSNPEKIAKILKP